MFVVNKKLRMPYSDCTCAHDYLSMHSSHFSLGSIVFSEERLFYSMSKSSTLPVELISRGLKKMHVNNNKKVSKGKCKSRMLIKSLFFSGSQSTITAPEPRPRPQYRRPRPRKPRPMSPFYRRMNFLYHLNTLRNPWMYLMGYS